MPRRSASEAIKGAGETSTSFHLAAALFAAATIVFAVLFTSILVRRDEIRSGLATYGVITGVTAVGLWRRRNWGRSLALLVTLASAGLGVLTLTSIVFARQGSPIVPAVVLVASTAVAYWLSRPTFDVDRTDD
jgi:uncharacterized membrane protein (DUF2068 family)